jgi:hypothetical protein
LQADAEELGRAQVTRLALVQPSATQAGQVVLRYQSGAPALLVTPHGRGLVALWTTTIDRDWTDLPLQPTWLPMLRTVALALAGERSLQGRHAIEVGDLAVLARDERADQLELRLEPSGQAPRLVVEASAQRGRSWEVAKVEQPGRYTATELRAGAALTSRTLIVVPPAAESDLAPAPAGGGATQQSGPAGKTPARAKAPGQAMVLVVLLVLLTFEAAVLARGTWQRGGTAS